MRSMRERSSVELCDTEADVCRVIAEAGAAGQKVRVVGSGHSFAPAIWPDGAGVRRLSLDPLSDVTIHPDASGALVEVGAGCRLGRDPLSPTSSWSTSLNAQLQQAGYALSDLGGISHQSVAGFLSTGSSGGSVKYSIYDAIEKVRFVDGTGKVHEVSRNDSDPSTFHASVVSLGLLGVVTRVWLRAEPSFNIAGREQTTETSRSEIDFFGSGGPRVDFETYLRETEYTRLMWWPQNNFDRMTVWQASRQSTSPDFKANPYEELGRFPRLASLAGCLIYTLVGNLQDLSRVPDKLDALGYWELLDEMFDGDPDPNACVAIKPYRKTDLREVVEFIRQRLGHRASHEPEAVKRRGLVMKLLSRAGKKADSVWDDRLSNLIVDILESLLDGALDFPLAKPLGRYLERCMPNKIDELISLFVEIKSADFSDTWMCGLPMDNQMDDRLWKTEFTELWIPLERAREVMCDLRDFYRAGGDEKLAYQRTGAFSCELYAAKKNNFWLSPSYGTDVFRVDVFWFGYNAADPRDSFYPQYWELLKKYAFRPHWGKILPPASAQWQNHYRAALPKLDDFLKLRAQLDPNGVLLTKYWQEHLGC